MARRRHSRSSPGRCGRGAQSASTRPSPRRRRPCARPAMTSGGSCSPRRSPWPPSRCPTTQTWSCWATRPTRPGSCTRRRYSSSSPGRVLVVDEAFADAVPGEPGSLSSRRDLPGVLVVRSLTKAWGLAGLRVGYLLGDPATIAELAQAQPPWPVNSLALTALEACSQPDAVAWSQQHAARMASWRLALADGLDGLPGVAVAAAGQAPFLLVRVGDATAVRERMRGLGIAVRRGDTFPGLGRQWLRIAVAAPEHHDRIVEAFARCTAGISAGTPAPAVPAAAPTAPLPRQPGGPASDPATGTVTGTATGAVTLIGAGPGGWDLITMRGWRALHNADVVVTDRRADPGLTGELRPGVLLIHAGKSPGP